MANYYNPGMIQYEAPQYRKNTPVPYYSSNIPGTPQWHPGYGPTQAWSPSRSNLVYTPSFEMPYYQETREDLLRGLQRTQGERAPLIERSTELLDLMAQQARGEGPSVAQEQLKQATERNIKQQRAIAAGQGGYYGSAAAQRGLAIQGAEVGQEAAGQSGILRAQEMLSAREQMANYTQGLQALNNQMLQYYTDAGMDLNNAQLQANMALQQLFSQNESQFQATLASVGNSIRAAQAQKYAAPFGVLSDERKKEDITKDNDAYNQFLDTIGSIRGSGVAKGLGSSALKYLSNKATGAGLTGLGEGLGVASNILGGPGTLASNTLGEIASYIPGRGGDLARSVLGGTKKAVEQPISGLASAQFSPTKGAGLSQQITSPGATIANAAPSVSGAGVNIAQPSGLGPVSGVQGATVGPDVSSVAKPALSEGAVQATKAGGTEGASSAGSVASAIASYAAGLIGGRPGPADRQYVEPVQGTLQKTAVSPSAYQPATGNTGEIPQNKGIIGAILSYFASDVNMKRDISSGDRDINRFLDQGIQQAPISPVVDTGTIPTYGRGLLEAISDEDQKRNVQEDPDLDQFLDALDAYSFNYKEPEMDGYGRHYSIMAQDLEKTPVGQSFVMDTPRGKMIDYGKGFGVLLAAQGVLNDRLKKLEGKRNATK